MHTVGLYSGESPPGPPSFTFGRRRPGKVSRTTAGFSLLDLLITLLVLALVLLAAVKQSEVYNQSADRPTPQEQPAAAQSSAPPQ